MAAKEIVEGIYEVAGPDVSGGGDASAFLVLFGDSAAIIDAGCEADAAPLLANAQPILKDSGSTAEWLVLTHNHIDHVGGAAALKKDLGVKIAMHAADAAALEDGDDTVTAANWYGHSVRAATVDLKIDDEQYELPVGQGALTCIHTPGHTPGSMVITMERGGSRILFGQDIHGPFAPQFGSDIMLWRRSMKKLLDLECDILCEGHFGIIRPAMMVESFIQKHLKAHC